MTAWARLAFYAGSALIAAVSSRSGAAANIAVIDKANPKASNKSSGAMGLLPLCEGEV